jgi:ribosomal protein L11 methyltransferase
VEAVSQKLVELGSNGVAVEDLLDWETAADNNSVTIRGYFPLSFLSDGRNELLSGFLIALPTFGLATATLFTRQVDEANWEQAWKQYWHPTPVGKRLLVLPAWLTDDGQSGRIVLRLDPGAAFGTGTHETTRFCLELLESIIKIGDTVLDLGCGSGILALAARLLGADDVRGVDLDEAAIRASRDNAALNNLHDVVTFDRADLFSESTWQALGQAHVVTANLTADALLAIQKKSRYVVRPGGHLIISGIIRSREAEVVDAYMREGYKIIEKKSAGEWIALLLELKE